MKICLEKYLNSNVDKEIESVILGQTTCVQVGACVEIKDFLDNGRFELNNSQIEAVKNALKYRVSIIEGPPGTGKTQTLSALVYYIDKLCQSDLRRTQTCLGHHSRYESHYYCLNDLNKYFSEGSKILVCAASNNPIFDLRQKLEEKGIPVLQILATSKEDEYKNDPGTLKYIYDAQIKSNQLYNDLSKELQNKYTSSGDRTKIEKKLNYIRRNTRFSIVNQFRIICCTTGVLKNSFLNGISFEFVLFDEATQALEPDTIQCLLKGARHLVLVGDLHQLGSVITSTEARDLGLDIPTIERLQHLGVPKTLLNTQYRMDPFISEFSNQTFYKGQIKNAHEAEANSVFPWPIQTTAFFHHVNGKELVFGTSFYNIIEAKTVISNIEYLVWQGVSYDEIAVITPYSAQRTHLKSELKKIEIYGIEVMSVDASQGREKNFIIFSCVRSNEREQVGFLDDYRRLNVALTRARFGLVVCGNAHTVKNSELWGNLIWYFKENNAIFTGNIEEIKSMNIRLSKPEPYVVAKCEKYRS